MHLRVESGWFFCSVGGVGGGRHCVGGDIVLLQQLDSDGTACLGVGQYFLITRDLTDGRYIQKRIGHLWAYPGGPRQPRRSSWQRAATSVGARSLVRFAPAGRGEAMREGDPPRWRRSFPLRRVGWRCCLFESKINETLLPSSMWYR